MRLPLLIVLFICHFGINLSAQDTRGVGKLNQTNAATETGRFFLWTIAIDEYAHWTNLKNAVNDVKGIEEILTEKYGFTLPVAPLYNADATRDRIFQGFDELRKIIEPNDNLLIFFAGHGHTRVDSIGDRVVETGYLIPVDGDAPSEGNWSSYIDVDHFLKLSGILNAQHVTIMLDACHSGIALGQSAQLYRSAAEFAPSLNHKTSRRVITSAQRDQLASDKGPYPNNSLFAGMLLNGLKEGDADLDRNGFITSSELGLFLQQRVGKYSGNLQTPDFGAFILDDRGEMILEVDASSPRVLINNAKSQLREGKVEAFFKTYEKLEQQKTESLEFYTLQFWCHWYRNDVDKALISVESLKKIAGEFIPEDFSGLILLPFLKQWLEIFKTVETTAEVEINLQVNGKELPVFNADSLCQYYQLPYGETYQLKIHNKTDHPVFVYSVFILPKGGGNPVLLWDDLDLLYKKGISPGQVVETLPFKHSEIKGIEEIRLYIAPEPLLFFLLPADTRRADLPAIERPEGLKTQLIRLIYN